MREELKEKIATSIERYKAFEPPEGYYMAFAGGKDSCVIKALADMAGVKYTAVYRNTGIDPPELVRFIKDFHPDVVMDIPRYPDGTRVTMWNLIEKRQIPPTRLVRYCCQYLKEDGGDGRLTVTGVRWAESGNRKANQGIATIMDKKAGRIKEFQENPNFSATSKGGVVLVNDNTESRRMIEQCYKRHKTTLNPIIDWTNEDVWEFIRENNIPYCKLYDEGFDRLGCIGCPMAQRRRRRSEFARYPRYKKLYLQAFEKMLEARKASGKDDMHGTWQTAQDVFNWWMENDIIPGQISWFDD